MTGFTYLTFFLRTFYICISHSHGTLTQRKKRCLILQNKDVFARLACDFLVFEEQRFRPQTWRKHFFASGLVGCWSANSRTYVGYFCSFFELCRLSAPSSSKSLCHGDKSMEKVPQNFVCATVAFPPVFAHQLLFASRRIVVEVMFCGVASNYH